MCMCVCVQVCGCPWYLYEVCPYVYGTFSEKLNLRLCLSVFGLLLSTIMYIVCVCVYGAFVTYIYMYMFRTTIKVKKIILI